MPGPVRFHPLRVSAVEPLCADAFSVSFEVPAEQADRYAHRAGQFLILRPSGGAVQERRSYSICSAEGEGLRVGVRRVPGGLFSERVLPVLRPGDVLESLPPRGAFTLAGTTGERHHGFVAGGSGITPVLSLVATLLAGDPAARASLVYVNRGSRSVMFADELADLKDRYRDRLHLVHLLSREVGFVDLLSGRLDGERLADLLDHVVAAGDVGHWWLCGPLGLVDTVTEGLLRRGIPPAAVHSELFFTGEAPPPAPPPGSAGPQVSVTLRLAGRTSTVGIPATATILDGALRSHSDLPFACRSGVCGTCRAKVVDGEVRQRRSFALGPKDRSDGFVLTCQAVPASDCITVDYDA